SASVCGRHARRQTGPERLYGSQSDRGSYPASVVPLPCGGGVTMSQPATMNRRIFLRGVAGAALAAPFLSSLGPRRARAQAKPPTRLVIFYTNNGVLTNRWFPTVANGPIDANSFPGTLKPLAPFAPKLLFPRGLGMYPRGAYQVNGKSYFDPHDQGMGSKLT